MPQITNSTVKKNVARIATVLNTRGENWAAEHSATVIVRSILEELGLTEELGDEYKEERAACVALVKPFCTAAKNYQQTWICSTVDEQGKPLMPKVENTEKADKAEFA